MDATHEQKVVNIAGDQVKPPLGVRYQVCRFPAGDIGVIEIPPVAPGRAHEAKVNGHWVIYIRAGSHNREATPDEKQQLFSAKPTGGPEPVEKPARRLEWRTDYPEALPKSARNRKYAFDVSFQVENVADVSLRTRVSVRSLSEGLAFQLGTPRRIGYVRRRWVDTSPKETIEQEIGPRQEERFSFPSVTQLHVLKATPLTIVLEYRIAGFLDSGKKMIESGPHRIQIQIAQR